MMPAVLPMPATVTKAQRLDVRHVASRLVEAAPSCRSVGALAGALGIEVVRTRLPTGVLGTSWWELDAVWVAEALDERAADFVIAHELMHLFGGYEGQRGGGGPEAEALCDHGAEELVRLLGSAARCGAPVVQLAKHGTRRRGFGRTARII